MTKTACQADNKSDDGTEQSSSSSGSETLASHQSHLEHDVFKLFDQIERDVITISRATRLLALGSSSFRNKEHSLALKCFEAIVVTTKWASTELHGDKIRIIADAFSNIATVYLQLGRATKAACASESSLRFHHQLLQYQDKAQTQSMAAVYYQLGILRTIQGFYEKARQALNQALLLQGCDARGAALKAQTCQALGRVAYFEGNWEHAVTHYETAYNLYSVVPNPCQSIKLARILVLRKATELFLEEGHFESAYAGYEAVLHLLRILFTRKEMKENIHVRRHIKEVTLCLGELRRQHKPKITP